MRNKESGIHITTVESFLTAMQTIANKIDISKLSAEQIIDLQLAIDLLQEKIVNNSQSEFHEFPTNKFRYYGKEIEKYIEMLDDGTLTRDFIEFTYELEDLCKTLLKNLNFIDLKNVESLLNSIKTRCRYLREDASELMRDRIVKGGSLPAQESAVMTRLYTLYSDIDSLLENNIKN